MARRWSGKAVTAVAARVAVSLVCCAFACSCFRTGGAADAASASVHVSKEPVDPAWQTIESATCTIRYLPGAGLKRIERQLRRRAFYFSSRSPARAASVEEKIAYHVDYLMGRAKELLDMYPAMPRLTIKIFADREELGERYDRIFGRAGEERAFYVHTYATIYTSEDDISDSLLIHEMAHAIIDHYFSTVPPSRITEIIAEYVDMHLDED